MFFGRIRTWLEKCQEGNLNLGQAVKLPGGKSCLLSDSSCSVKVSKHFNEFPLGSNKAGKGKDVIPPDRPSHGSYSSILDSQVVDLDLQ